MIKVGKEIYTLLKNDEQLNHLIQGRVYPIASSVDTQFPFVLFSRNSYKPEHSKDGITKKKAVVTVMVMSDKYDVGVDIADEVNRIITSHSRYWRLENVDEDFTENEKTSVYLQILDFTIEK